MGLGLGLALRVHNFLFPLIADWKPKGDPNSGLFLVRSGGPGKWVINSCVWLSVGGQNEVYISSIWAFIKKLVVPSLYTLNKWLKAFENLTTVSFKTYI